MREALILLALILLALTLLAGCAVVPAVPYDAYDGPYYYSPPAYVYYEYGYHRPWHRSYYGHGSFRPRHDCPPVGKVGPPRPPRGRPGPR